MSYTNQTPLLGLPQWIGTDKPSFSPDISGGFLEIDKQFRNNITSFEEVNGRIDQTNTDVASNLVKIEANTREIQNVSDTFQAFKNGDYANFVNATNTSLSGLRADLTTTNGNVTNLTTRMTAAEGRITTNQNSINTINNTTIPAIRTEITNAGAIKPLNLNNDSSLEYFNNESVAVGKVYYFKVSLRGSMTQRNTVLFSFPRNSTYYMSFGFLGDAYYVYQIPGSESVTGSGVISVGFENVNEQPLTKCTFSFDSIPNVAVFSSLSINMTVISTQLDYAF